jgi:hypothetical protein
MLGDKIERKKKTNITIKNNEENKYGVLLKKQIKMDKINFFYKNSK